MLGNQGAQKPITVTAAGIAGDFYFPIHDGSLPLDKIALFDIWQQALQFIAGNQILAGQYDLGRVFEFVAKLGGAENIDQFKLQPQSPEQISAGVQSGNLLPVGGPNGVDLSQGF